jgi:hypothetical protein
MKLDLARMELLAVFFEDRPRRILLNSFRS